MSNALEAASLIMVPSGYEDGTLGSLKPTDGSGDFTFSRGSNLSATRINEQGYIEKGYENLLLQSNSFTTTWTTTRATISGGQSGYDGTNDAWLLNSTDPSSSFVLQSVNVSGIKTISIYAKANTANWILMYSAGGSIDSWFDIQNGQLGSKGAGAISTHIETIGNGWYRCSVLLTNNISDFRVYVSNGNNSFLSDVGDSVYIQDAMLNQGLVAYPYIETTTAPVAGGILEDMPRLDWSGSCPSLLLEPQRTNIVPNSEYFGDTSTYNLASVSLTNIQSPDGYSPVYKITAASTNTSHLLRSVRPNVLENSTNTISAFFKSAEQSKAGLLFGGGSLGLPSIDYRLGKFDLTGAGSIIQTPINGSADIQSIGNGWYRCSISVTTLAAGGVWHDSVILNDNGDIDYTGDNTSGIYVWGTQFEQDATYPTSYIPTYGVSQTRLDDVCMNAGTQSLFNNDGGVLYAEVEPLTNGSDVGTLSLRGAGSTATGLLTLKFNYGINTLQYFIYNAGVLEHNRIVSFNLNQKIKVAAKYSIGECVLYINGIKQYTRAEFTGFAANTLQDMSFNTFSTEYLEAKVNQVLYFPTALSDEECIALTTIT